MIDQDRVSVEVFRRSKTKFWVLEALEDLNETLTLKTSGVDIPLRAIYENIELEG